MITILFILTFALDIVPEVRWKVRGRSATHSIWRQIFSSSTKNGIEPYRAEGDWLKHDTSGMDDCLPQMSQLAYIRTNPDVISSIARFGRVGAWHMGRSER